MKVEIKVPDLGESIVEVTLGTLLKESGSVVEENDEICELETEKVNQLLYAPTSGTITWNKEIGAQIKVGEVIGSIDSEKRGERAPVAEKKPAPPAKEPPATPAKKPETAPARKPEAAPAKKPEAAPVKEEVKRRPIEGESRTKMSTLRKTISKKLVETMRETAMLTTFNEVDMSELMALRGRLKEPFEKKYGFKLGLTSFFIQASVEALKEFPLLNGYVDGDEIVQREAHHIGVAIGGAKGGLVTVALRDADKMAFFEIERTLSELAERAKTGKLRMEDIEGATFTITNGGVYGSLLSTPLLSPKQSAILGMHKIEKRACVIDDQIAIRSMMYLALSYDHRMVDGKEAITFLVRIKEILENPSELII